MMLPCIFKIAKTLTGNPDPTIEQYERGGGEVLGDYGWQPTTDEDDFLPDNGTIWMATEVCGGRRIVLEAVLDLEVCFLAESQTSGPPWKLEHQWGPTEWARPRMPRTGSRVEKLTEDVIIWITKSAAAKGSPIT